METEGRTPQCDDELMLPEEARELLAICEQATSAPWRTRRDALYGGIVSDVPGHQHIFGGDRKEGFISPDDPNAVFACAARTGLPKALRTLLHLWRAGA